MAMFRIWKASDGRLLLGWVFACSFQRWRRNFQKRTVANFWAEKNTSFFIWSYFGPPCKWPKLTWVRHGGYKKNVLIGVIAPLVTSKVPPCRNLIRSSILYQLRLEESNLFDLLVLGKERFGTNGASKIPKVFDFF